MFKWLPHHSVYSKLSSGYLKNLSDYERLRKCIPKAHHFPIFRIQLIAGKIPEFNTFHLWKNSTQWKQSIKSVRVTFFLFLVRYGEVSGSLILYPRSEIISSSLQMPQFKFKKARKFKTYLKLFLEVKRKDALQTSNNLSNPKKSLISLLTRSI